MKNLIIINGTMGVGKTTTCNELLKSLKHCVFLDGDWCWSMNPFIVCDETKQMVMKNITYCLRSFLECSIYETVLFCWVIHEQTILTEILNTLSDLEFKLHVFTLTATPEALEKRLLSDVKNDIRTVDVISRSLERLSYYDLMDTIKIDISELTPTETADIIRNKIN